METTLTLNPEQIPPSFARCFQSDCPKKADCIRYLANQSYNPTQLVGNAVYPTARTDDRCRFFKPIRVVRVAWGFSQLYDEVKSKDIITLRKHIYGIVGSEASYYRYRKGVLKLLPEQQQAISRLFQSYGYSSDVVFDHYEDLYDCY